MDPNPGIQVVLCTDYSAEAAELRRILEEHGISYSEEYREGVGFSAVVRGCSYYPNPTSLFLLIQALKSDLRVERP